MGSLRGANKPKMWKAIVVTSVLIFAFGLVFADGSSRHTRSYGTRRLESETLCANSSDVTECRRRVEVCRNMHRNSNQRSRMHEILTTCATQLNITLPSGSNETNAHQAFRNWMRNNPEDKRRLFNCAHEGLYNEDGTMNRAAMVEKVRTLLQDQNEDALLQELTNRVNTCPEGESRREFFHCVFMGCATPQ